MPNYRVAVIGHTGRGNYGHGLDVVWREIANAQIVAVADANEAGRNAAQKRLGAKTAYADYRQMLQKERPNVVSVGTIVWLSSELMFFASLFAMYFTIRSINEPVWPAKGVVLDLKTAAPFTETTSAWRSNSSAYSCATCSRR